MFIINNYTDILLTSSLYGAMHFMYYIILDKIKDSNRTGQIISSYKCVVYEQLQINTLKTSLLRVNPL